LRGASDEIEQNSYARGRILGEVNSFWQFLYLFWQFQSDMLKIWEREAIADKADDFPLVHNQLRVTGSIQHRRLHEEKNEHNLC
jgi:hypothetical protein